MSEEKDNQNKKRDSGANNEDLPARTGAEKIIEEKLADCRKQAEEYLNGWKRTKADFLNYQKDEAKRLEEFAKFANEDLILQLIPLADEADIALAHIPKEVRENHPDWVSGAMEIRKKFNGFLEGNGISKIKTVGEVFSPSLHEAVETVESDRKPGEIMEEVRAGYTLYGKVIRPARVKISKEIKK